MKDIDHSGVRTWVEIDKKALKNNYAIFRNLIAPKCKLMAIAKSNAYGHGLVDYSKEMERLGCDFIGVDSMTEAIALRREGIKSPILVLGYTLPERYREAAENNISITISSLDQFKETLRFIGCHSCESRNLDSGSQAHSLPVGRQVRNDRIINIHIKIDTGMHRQGFYYEELKEVIKTIKTLGHVRIEGVYTHFASAKDPAFPTDTDQQITLFKKACKLFGEAKINPIRHAAATSGTIIFPESHFDMVRIGIGMMGLWPSLETKSYFSQKLTLKPALSWKTIVSEIKAVKAGEKIGYDFTESVENDSKIAILPIGYWHGFRRNLSSIGHVLIQGQRAKIIGRVSMDMVVVDISGINVKVGDIATIIGKDGKEKITAEEMAALSDSSWYETITTINPLIKRIYV